MQGKGLGGTFNSTTSQITMFAPVNAAFTSNMFQVSTLVSQGEALTREGCHDTDLFLGLSYRQRALLVPTVPLEATSQMAVFRYCLLCVERC